MSDKSLTMNVCDIQQAAAVFGACAHFQNPRLYEAGEPFETMLSCMRLGMMSPRPYAEKFANRCDAVRLLEGQVSVCTFSTPSGQFTIAAAAGKPGWLLTVAEWETWQDVCSWLTPLTKICNPTTFMIGVPIDGRPEPAQVNLKEILNI